VRSGALPSLKRVDASLQSDIQQAVLTDGLLGGLHELRVDIRLWPPIEDDEEEEEYYWEDANASQLEALGMVRQLPALAKLEVRTGGDEDDQVQWPNFIPPSLKALTIDVDPIEDFPTTEPLLPALPGMLGASGARLERLEMRIPAEPQELMIEGLVHVAPALRCCSLTLQNFILRRGGFYGEEDEDSDEYKAQVKRLRVQWADVLAGVSACRELQVLVLPCIKAASKFPLGTIFGRLTHLELFYHKAKHPPNAGVMRLWELMASGGLPVLAKLSVTPPPGAVGGGGECGESGGAGVGGCGRHPDAALLHL
jgi:hypothetical protein